VITDKLKLDLDVDWFLFDKKDRRKERKERKKIKRIEINDLNKFIKVKGEK